MNEEKDLLDFIKIMKESKADKTGTYSKGEKKENCTCFREM